MRVLLTAKIFWCGSDAASPIIVRHRAAGVGRVVERARLRRGCACQSGERERCDDCLGHCPAGQFSRAV
jgi:hypothetical protein